MTQEQLRDCLKCSSGTIASVLRKYDQFVNCSYDDIDAFVEWCWQSDASQPGMVVGQRSDFGESALTGLNNLVDLYRESRG